jgi:hypothetical protein
MITFPGNSLANSLSGTPTEEEREQQEISGINPEHRNIPNDLVLSNFVFTKLTTASIMSPCI